MAKGWVGKLATGWSPAVAGCFDRPWDHYAEAAVKLYEDFGAAHRAELIRKELGL